MYHVYIHNTHTGIHRFVYMRKQHTIVKYTRIAIYIIGVERILIFVVLD